MSAAGTAGAGDLPGATATVAALLAEARARGVERLDAQRLLAHVLERPRSWLIAHDDAPLAAPTTERLRTLIGRRADGEPLAYLLGNHEFHGLALDVTEAVLVPRADTEVLVDWALELLLAGPLGGLAAPRVADLGTGSGAIALAVKHRQPAAQLTATDVSAAALDVARANAARLGIDVVFAAGAWWQALEGRCFDLVLSNPPYIAGDDTHLPALRHEPRIALTPGGDGLGALREIVGGAPAHLERGGWLLLEHGFDQADAVQTLLRLHGFGDVATRPDLAGRPRCSGGRRR